jgi:phage terminase large subunit
MELLFDTHGNDKQKLCAAHWLDDQVSSIVYGGSKGSAKSFTGASLILGDALIYPDTRYFIARKKLNDLRKFTRDTIEEVFNAWGITPNMWSYNGQDNYYQLYNDSKVFFLEAKYMPSDPKYTRFGSMQFTRGWIEEAGEFEAEAASNLMAAVGRWKNDVYNLKAKVLQTCNPAKNYLYREYYKKHKGGTLEDHKRFIQALPQDNKMLPAGYIDHLHQVLSFSEKQRLLYGLWEFDDDPNACTTFEAVDMLWDYPLPNSWSDPYYITSDIAFESDKSIIILWNGLNVVKIIEVDRDKKPEDLIKEMQLEYGIPGRHVAYDGTGSGNYLKNYLPGAYQFHSAAKPIKERRGAKEYEHLKTQCYWHLAKLINEHKIQIHTKYLQEDTTDELLQIKTKPRESLEHKIQMIKKDDIKKIIGRSPDILDALSMRMVWELKGAFKKNF